MVRNLQQDTINAVKAIEAVERIVSEQVENVYIAEIKYKEIAEALEESGNAVLTINRAGKHRRFAEVILRRLFVV